MSRFIRPLPLLIVAGALLSAPGCSQDHAVGPPSGTSQVSASRHGHIPDFDAADFVDEIENPYFPVTPGAKYVYRADTEDGVEVVKDEVTFNHKVIIGVTTTEVHNTVTLDGSLVEETFDWYAEDEDGNVWYLGEDSKEYDNGVVVSTEGSWEAGVDGARPGIIMLARPRIGMEYYQEFLAGVAEDKARIVSRSKTVRVPFGKFVRCLKTLDFTALSPGAREFKYYAPGVGLVLEVDPDTGVRSELISVMGLDDDDDHDD